MDTANKHVATYTQQQQCDLMGATNKGGCLVFDLFKNRISKPEKEISKKDRIISFLIELLCQKNSLPKMYIMRQSNSELRVNFMNRTIARFPLRYRQSETLYCDFAAKKTDKIKIQ